MISGLIFNPRSVLTGVAEDQRYVLEEGRPVGQRFVQVKQDGFYLGTGGG